MGMKKKLGKARSGRKRRIYADGKDKEESQREEEKSRG